MKRCDLQSFAQLYIKEFFLIIFIVLTKFGIQLEIFTKIETTLIRKLSLKRMFF